MRRKNERKSLKRVCIMIDEETIDRIRDISDREMRSFSGMVNYILAQYAEKDDLENGN